MRAHYLQHVPFEGIGNIATWLNSTGYTVTHTKLFQSTEFPDPESIDLLIVMGGPMSVNDEDEYPWLVKEKTFIRNVVESRKAVLGICLGAQLIAGALGAKVYPNDEKEIGWYPVYGTETRNESLFSFPSSGVDVFHWHGETFDLPPGAKRIASSEACKNQAFQIGNSVMGLQFHLETTLEAIQEMVDNDGEELVSSPYVQSKEKILAAEPEQYKAIHQMMNKVLDYISGQDKLKLKNKNSRLDMA
ncbi:MAG: type 1 glutamine amidotransferase [Balneolaceae bacterium]|jgi:GMP synthase-like glutamine amidotransferase